jgi:hypothetical protein
VWARAYTLASYLAGNALQKASGAIDQVIVGVAVLAIATVLYFVRRQIATLGLKAEAAYPGSLERSANGEDGDNGDVCYFASSSSTRLLGATMRNASSRIVSISSQ